MDEFTREGLALDVALSTSAERVIGVLTMLVAQHGAPAYLRSDNGAEFVATAVQLWLAECGVQTLYIEPGKPRQNRRILTCQLDSFSVACQHARDEDTVTLIRRHSSKERAMRPTRLGVV